jgi:hypothetical protein
LESTCYVSGYGPGCWYFKNIYIFVNVFSNQDVLKDGGDLLPLFFNIASGYAIGNVQEVQARLNWN